MVSESQWAEVFARQRKAHNARGIFYRGDRVRHHHGHATGEVLRVVTETAPDRAAYIARSMAGENLPPFPHRPAYLIGWEGKSHGQWSRGEYLRPE